MHTHAHARMHAYTHARTFSFALTSAAVTSTDPDEPTVSIGMPWLHTADRPNWTQQAVQVVVSGLKGMSSGGG